LDFLSLKNDVNVPSKSNKQKNFVGLLKVNDENPHPDPNPDQRHGSRIHTNMPWIRKTDFGVGHKFKCTVPSVFSVGTKIKKLEAKVKGI
jgi:hypothetical protein